jgi:outer membrane protein assembly factor BamB
MEGANPQRNRATDARITPPLVAQDRFVVGGDTELGSPVSVTKEMLFADADHRLHAFGLADGQERWRIDLLGSYLSPAVADDKLFVRVESGEQGYLVALDLASGEPRWDYQFPTVGSAYNNVGGHVTSPVVVDGLVIVGAAETMTALDVESGVVRWTFAADEPITAAAAVTEDTVYFADFTHLYALTLESGAERWRFKLDAATLFFAPIVANGIVFTTSKNAIQAVDAQNGREVWSRTFQEFDVIPAAATDDQLYVKAVNQLWALDSASGEVRWNYATVNFLSLPAVTAEELYLIVRSDNGSYLQALSRSDGKLVWQSEKLQLSNSAPVAAGNAIYVRTINGGILGFR